MTTASTGCNIAESLSLSARRRPDAVALIDRKAGRKLTFKQLDAEAERCAGVLKSIGVERGMRAAVMVPPGPDFFALAYGLFRLGAIPVLIDPGMGWASLGRCLDEAKPGAFIGVPLAHGARIILGWAGSARIKVVVGRTFRKMRAEAPATAATDSRDLAAILFTSGSTGAPKGAVYTHGQFAAQLDRIRSHFGTVEGEVDVPTFPLFALFDPALGLTAVLPDMNFTKPGSVDPAEVVSAVAESGAKRMFGSPAVLDRLGRAGLRLPGVRKVVSAGAPLAPKILARFVGLLDSGAEVRTAYGATEALPVSSITDHEILGETAAETANGKGVCVGKPVDGVEVRIAPISDEELTYKCFDKLSTPGVSGAGEVVVAGENVTESYFGREKDTELAKIRLEDGRVAHRMGDLGYLDGSGRLWLCGRKSHRVETRSGTLFTLCVEGVFNAHPKVKRTALVGVGKRPDQRPVLCVELEAGEKPSDDLLGELLALGAKFSHSAGIRDVLFHPSFPVDVRHNAKIFREKLVPWAEARL
jgi:acyl-CoA synthetase (AMP-forming)/AMP-acid ligase II